MMGRSVVTLLACLAAWPAFAGSVVPVRPIPANTVVAAVDVSTNPAAVPGGVQELQVQINWNTKQKLVATAKQ